MKAKKPSKPPRIVGNLWANIDERGFPVVYACREDAEGDCEPDEITARVQVRYMPRRRITRQAKRGKS